MEKERDQSNVDFDHDDDDDVLAERNMRVFCSASSTTCLKCLIFRNRFDFHLKVTSHKDYVQYVYMYIYGIYIVLYGTPYIGLFQDSKYQIFSIGRLGRWGGWMLDGCCCCCC